MNTEPETLSTKEEIISPETKESLGKLGLIFVTGEITVKVDDEFVCDPSNDCHPEGCYTCIVRGDTKDLREIGYEVIKTNLTMRLKRD